MKSFVVPATLLLMSLASPALAQFVPPPEAVVSNSIPTFPLPELATEHLTRPFQSTSSSPDWKAVRLLAEMSFLAYEDSIPTVQNRLRLYNLTLGEFVTVDNHHFITAWDKDKEVLIIAFRGTDIAQLADYWTDLDYAKITTDMGEVHKGFYLASETLMRSVVAAIEHRGRPRNIWLTGHSLGGAIATLSMRRLESSGHRVNGLITFGQPRVGDRPFTEAMNRSLGSRILRVINEDDVVVSLPPRIPIVMPSFYSCGSVLQFLNGKIVRSPGIVVMAKPPLDMVDDLFAAPSTDSSDADDLFGIPSTDVSDADDLFRAPPPPENVGPVFQPVDIDLNAPKTPDGLVPPDPEALTAEQFEQLKDILDDRDIEFDDLRYGAPLGGPVDRLNLKRRAGNHLMHLYIQNIERFAAEGK
ncbi:lipase family protein [Aureliella helgolandensis]|uniref:Lipase (Class 3) n=1 Tax=Aureliella helgolandensis TaxID=2527968 RepID=A0A518GBS5_9BACT|nr:lipase family protein [Aureliella helgolandensis]QDV26039.1 Lipase (class 3) [Aureliella helgolandensis]